MITILPFIDYLNKVEVLKVCGLNYHQVECVGEKCRRKDHPNDKVKTQKEKCSWTEETLVADEIDGLGLDSFGKKTVHKMFIPIRWYNFLWSVSEVEKRETKLSDMDLIKKSLSFAKSNCFDFDNKPKNMAKELGFTSYSVFLETLKTEYN